MTAKVEHSPVTIGLVTIGLTIGLAIAVAAGLVGAFVGLDTHGFWFDELYTAWITAPSGDLAGLIANISADVHPPLYYLAIHLYAKLFGTSEVALRSFSALCATGAVLLFVTATGRWFSLNARLFGAAIATGSLFWFYQAQNARSYALCLLLGTAILALCLSLMAAPRESAADRRKLAGLAVLMLVGSFVHFYLMFVSLAVLIVLGFHRPGHWRWYLCLAALLLVTTALYVKLVVNRHAYTSVDEFWMANTLGYYRFMLTAAAVLAVGKLGALAIGLCLTGSLWGRFFAVPPGASTPDGKLLRLATTTLGVPVIVLGGAVVSSTILSPNFSERNFLITAPFLWGAFAMLYDLAVGRLRDTAKAVLEGVLVLVVLAMSLIVTGRFSTDHGVLLWREAFRASAGLIKTFPGCRDQPIPVLTTDKEAWYKPGYGDVVYAKVYGWYLKGFAVPTVLFMDDVKSDTVPEKIRALLRRRIEGEGCPVLVWSAHNGPGDDQLTALKERLLAAAGVSAAPLPLQVREFRGGRFGFVLYVQRKAGE